MTKRVATLVLMALFAVARAEAAPLKVVTWNLHHGRDINGHNTVDAQARWLAAERPDIVLLQEAEQFSAGYGNFDHVTYIRNKLQTESGRPYHAFWSNASGADYGTGAVNAILSVFPLVSVDGRSLPYGVPLTMANVQVLPARTIALFCIHLTSAIGNDAKRATQVAELTYWLTVRGVTTRLGGGDWNLVPASVPIAPMQYWYTDLYDKARSQGDFSGPTDTRPVYQSNSVVGRIDALFLGKSWPSWVTLTAVEHVNTGLSDHFAVIAQVDVR
jgi:endonuclease/exonuclease/phosphatase family metal-dependent hydrolase